MHRVQAIVRTDTSGRSQLIDNTKFVPGQLLTNANNYTQQLERLFMVMQLFTNVSIINILHNLVTRTDPLSLRLFSPMSAEETQELRGRAMLSTSFAHSAALRIFFFFSFIFLSSTLLSWLEKRTMRLRLHAND